MLKKLLALTLALFMLAFASCGKDVEETESDITSEFSYTFTDSAGNTVTLNKRPEKVAVLFSSYADIWVSAGGKVDITVGESVERGFAPENAVLVDDSAGHTALDMETLIAEAPDFVIGTTDYECDADACSVCREAGIPAALFKVESFSDYLGVLKICCDITGNSDNYKKYGTDVGEEIDGIFSDIKGKGSPEILFVRAGSSAKSTKAKTADDNFAAKMLSELGAQNIADKARVLLDGLSLEEIVKSDPEFIFVSLMGNEEAARDYMQTLLSGEGWRDLSAVKDQKVIYLSKELFHFKPNSRWAQAYKVLAEELYK